MADFTVLDKIEKYARENSLPIYSIVMYNGGQYDERVITPSHLCNDLYSVSKNFTASAVGMCVDDGILSLDDTVYDIFSDERPAMNPLWREVTVERVISQTVGIDGMFLDIDTEDVFSYPDCDWLDIVLNHPFVTKPGERFAYSDSNFYLASRIVAKVTGRPMQELLQRRLFTPMKMQGWAWATCPLGHAMGGSGLFITARDMAKFGVMYMNGGVFEGKRILSADFVRRATSVVSRPDENGGYGLSFWIPDCSETRFTCGGMYNQSIVVDRDMDRVIAWQSHDTGRVGEIWRFI